MANSKQKKNAHFNILSIVAFCLAFLPIWGLAAPVLGIIALKQIKKTGERGKGLAITAIVLPLSLLIVFVGGIIGFVIWANNEAAKEAARLGTDTRTLQAIKQSVDTNCRTVNLTEGNTDFDGQPYGYDSVKIATVNGSFAVGKRQCDSGYASEPFIATKTNDRWKVVAVGQTPLCSAVNLYKIPVDIAPQCLDTSGSTVPSPAAAG